MKRCLWLLLIVVLLRVEHTAVDVAELEPVELIRVTVSCGQVQLQTDTGAQGAGDTLDRAFDELQRTATARVFPDTADYLVINTAAQPLLPQLAGLLRPSCRICIAEEAEDLRNLAKWLKIHPPQLRLLEFLG